MSPNDSSPPAATNLLAALDSRRSVSVKQLQPPGPDQQTLLRMLQSAARVPDHGKRVPFRFVAIRGDARHQLGEFLARRGAVVHPASSTATIEKDRGRFSYAPLVVMVVAVLGPDEKVPEQERLLSAGCACFALLQSAQALGFGACWLTGWPAYDDEVRRVLGVTAAERIAGFIHIGTPRLRPAERERPDPASLLTEWSPA
ncbi:MAG: nitroreductase [Pseudomonadota bacterium]|nr:nitroreductase [Pseudomonadota bacterium]